MASGARLSGLYVTEVVRAEAFVSPGAEAGVEAKFSTATRVKA
jgi:hypothetical protein